MRGLYSTLTIALTLAGTGCFAISDLSRFHEDQGCDVDLSLRDFTPHADDLFELRVVKVTADDFSAQPILGARAILDPMGAVNAHIVMFDAVPAGHTALEFYSDQSGDRMYSGPSDDHTWRIDNACVPASHTFVHRFDFADLMEPRPIGSDFVLHLRGMHADGNALEVRVISMPTGGPDSNLPPRTVGLYRKAAMTNADLDVTIAGILDEGARYQVTIWSDTTGDGFYDSPMNADPATRDESWLLPARLGADLTDWTFDHVADYNEIADNVVVLE